MRRHILIIQGHPDRSSEHFCHALADAYSAGAILGGHAVRLRDVSELDFPLLSSEYEWEHGALPHALHGVQQDIEWAEHLVFIYPLWLGDMPARLKALLEQVARPGFAFHEGGRKKGLSGRSAHIVVTMGMPALLYRWFFGAHSVKSFRRNILGFVGIKPVATTLIGSIGNMTPARAQRWFQRFEALGKQAS